MLFTAIKLFSLSGLRSQKTVNGATTQFYYTGADIIDEAVGGQLYASNIRGFGLIGRSSGGHYYTFIRDGHGDVNKILDETGAEVSNYQYDAYGNEIKTGAQTNTLYNPYRYSGEYYDEESGLYYLRARYYSPEIARFISEDPHWNVINMLYGDESKSPNLAAIVQSTNLYAYGMNNPIFYSDPSGKYAIPAVMPLPIPGFDLLEKGLKIFTVGYTVYKIITNDSTSIRDSVRSNTTLSDTLSVKTSGNSTKSKVETKEDVPPKVQRIPDIKYPGNDPAVSPGKDWEWRGAGNPESGKGSWYNPKTGESLHPDLNHPDPIGPHWDYRSSDGTEYRVNPDGTIIPKLKGVDLK